mgnify:CR=1 FL=1|tara:strand:+ start:388 stop:1152 length:765 start_codon:yes stop_codon:yes gene_type:complete
MEEIKIIILGIIQGVTEFLPISSSGHIVLFEHFLEITRDDIVIEVILHFGTLLSILIFFRKDIYNLLLGMINRDDDSLLYGYSIIAATMPIVLFSLFAKDYISSIFSINILIYTYVINSIILFMTKGKRGEKSQVTIKLAIVMGIAQLFALFPGISRAGITICTGLVLGYQQREVAKFSFFMAIPALVGAMIFELDNIIYQINGEIGILLIGFLASMLTGLLVLRLLFKILQTNRLWMFSYYCILIWLMILFIL